VLLFLGGQACSGGILLALGIEKNQWCSGGCHVTFDKIIKSVLPGGKQNVTCNLKHELERYFWSHNITLL